MKLSSRSLRDGAAIDPQFAFGRLADDAPMALSSNRNPHLAWSEVPEGTRSFALLCMDPDVPTVKEDVNRDDREIPVDQPRTGFCHWAMIDIAAEVREIAAGSCSDGVTPRGKRQPDGPPGSRQGLNDYTGFMSGDADMAGDYFGYDGPCPPWNDLRLHHYHFTVYALDLASVDLSGRFTGSDLLAAIEGHVLAQASLSGTYSLHPDVARGG